MTKLVPKMKFKEEINKTNNFSRLNLINNKLKIKRDLTEESNSELNHSWDFTPFPNLFFPSQKTYAIREINGLNFRNILNTITDRSVSCEIFSERSVFPKRAGYHP